MVKSALIRSSVYLCGSALLFARPYPATGSNTTCGSLIAFFSGPMYLFVAAQKHYSDRAKYGEISAYEVDWTAVVLLLVWISGMWALIAVERKPWRIILLAIVWCVIGTWNLVLFGLSGF
jgi:hypothetical protein